MRLLARKACYGPVIPSFVSLPPVGLDYGPSRMLRSMYMLPFKGIIPSRHLIGSTLIYVQLYIVWTVLGAYGPYNILQVVRVGRLSWRIG